MKPKQPVLRWFILCGIAVGMAALLVAGAVRLRRPIEENYTTSQRGQGFYYRFEGQGDAAYFVARLSAWLRKRGYTKVTAPDEIREIIGSRPNTYLIVARKPFDPSVPSYFYFTCRPNPADPSQIDVSLGEKHEGPESVHKRLLSEGSREFNQFSKSFPQALR